MNGQTFSNGKSGKKTTTAWRKKGKLDEVKKLLEKKKTNFDKISFYYVRLSIANAAGIR